MLSIPIHPSFDDYFEKQNAKIPDYKTNFVHGIRIYTAD
jgi:hypothetical protein